MLIILGLKDAKICKSRIRRQEISKEYVAAKIGFDTAENEPSRVSSIIPSQEI